jgi:hypothetical protein
MIIIALTFFIASGVGGSSIFRRESVCLRPSARLYGEVSGDEGGGQVSEAGMCWKRISRRRKFARLLTFINQPASS